MENIELVFIPTPGMGHLVSTVELAKLIIQRDHRISIVILIINFPSTDITKINSYIDTHSCHSSRLIFISLPPLSNPPAPASTNFFSTYIDLHKPLVKQVVEDRIKVGSFKPVAFVLDMFCTTMMDVAKELDLVSYIFFTSGAASLNLFFYFQSLASDHGVDVPTQFSNNSQIEVDVLGFRNRIPIKAMPVGFFEKEVLWERMYNQMSRFRQSKGILINTFMELESDVMQALMAQSRDNKIPNVYPVGPILALDNKSRMGFDKEEENSIMQWLGEQPDSSVVFLCFGSMGSFDEDQVKEIASGLERTKYQFLWSLRQPPSEGTFEPSPHDAFKEALPEGFLNRTNHRGKIICWAPQVSILAHRAIGGFVSHCGWNSTLESMWFGVPMGAWPIYAEQQLNAIELVNELGVAVDIAMDYRLDWRNKTTNFLVTSEEIEKGVNKLMTMNEETREKVRRISDVAKKTLDNGESSHYWLCHFIDNVLDNVQLA